jgi:hypothetical protein
MSKRLLHLIKNQPQVKVAQHTHDAGLDNVKFATFAAFVAGVFYFFGYYFFRGTGGVF